MSLPSCGSDLDDMQGMPMSAAWYHYLAYLRSSLRMLQISQADAVTAVQKSSPRTRENHEIAARLSAAALQSLDRKLRTMEATGALSPTPGDRP